MARLNQIQKGLIQLWAVRIMFALVVGFGLWELAHSETLLEYLGYSAFLAFYSVVAVLWMKVLEDLVDEERAKANWNDLDL